MNFPEEFLNFLSQNDLSADIYDDQDLIERYICLCPGKDVELDEILADFPSGVEKVTESPVTFYRLAKPYPNNVVNSSVLYQRSKLIALDLASGMAVKYLEIKHGDHVLDLCCAPGSKLVLAGFLAGSTGSVTGVDISPHRIATTRSIVKKYKLPKVRLFLSDGTNFDRRLTLPDPTGSSLIEDCYYSSSVFRKSKVKYVEDSLYDKVLVDAQCTHDGSIKHIIKCQTNGWSKSDLEQYSETALANLNSLQLELLRNGFRLLKPGGILVYSTCSRSRFQNESIVSQFLEMEPTAVPSIIPGESSHNKFFDPSTSRTGALFVCRLEKVSR